MPCSFLDGSIFSGPHALIKDRLGYNHEAPFRAVKINNKILVK